MSAKSKLLLSSICFSVLSLQAAPPSCRPLNSFEQGCELRQNQMAAAYNASSRIDVRGCWNLYATGKYLFWQPQEENLELGILNETNTYSLSIDGRVIDMHFLYKSGLQAGLGIYFDRDNWDTYFEYTWLTGSHHCSATAPANGRIIPFWGHPGNASGMISSAKGRWNLEINAIDGQLARSYYVGTKLTFRPFLALRALWLNQKYTAVYYQPLDLPYHVRNSSRSWGIGPEVGITSHWLLGWGVRVIGSAEADILFTRYNLHVTEEDSLDPSRDFVVDLHQRQLKYLRPHTCLDLGLGWGTYFNNHNYHFDMNATYGFQVFWSQNMFRNFVDDSAQGKSSLPNGDLYVQGLTGELRFDF